MYFGRENGLTSALKIALVLYARSATVTGSNLSTEACLFAILSQKLIILSISDKFQATQSVTDRSSGSLVKVESSTRNYPDATSIPCTYSTCKIFSLSNTKGVNFPFLSSMNFSSYLQKSVAVLSPSSRSLVPQPNCVTF